METQNENYEPGLDQNQGVVGTMARHEQPDDTELIGSRLPRLDPNIMTNQSGAAMDDDADLLTPADAPATADDEDVADLNDMGERQYSQPDDSLTDEARFNP